MNKLQRARQVRRAVMLNAEQYTDGQAATVPALYPQWRAGELVNEGDRRYYSVTERLYKAVSAHTTQADWTPDKTPALWTVIDVAHAGTKEDPIPAARGMEYVYGCYYLDPEDQKIYLCKREGASGGEKVTLQYLPHELLGQYFEVA